MPMKSIKPKATSLIAKTLASSVLLSSCSPNTDIELLSSVHDSAFDTNSSKGVSLSLVLNDDMKQKLTEIEPLVQEVINNPEVAHDLAANPQDFCKSRGYEFSFDMDDAIYKLIIALGNEKINKALKDNDFSRFIQLCTDLHLMNQDQIVKFDMIFKSHEEEEIFKTLATQLNGTMVETRGVGMAVFVSIVLVVAIVITLTVGMEEDQNTQPSSDCKVASDSITANNLSFLHYHNTNSVVLDMWALKDKNMNTCQLVSNYKGALAKQIVDYLKNNRPSVFEQFSEVQITEFLKSNMII